MTVHRGPCSVIKAASSFALPHCLYPTPPPPPLPPFLLSFLPPRLVIRSSRAAALRRAAPSLYVSLFSVPARGFCPRLPWALGVRKVTDTVKGHFAARSRLRKTARIASLAVKMAFRAVIRPTDSRGRLTSCAGRVVVVVVLVVVDVSKSPISERVETHDARFPTYPCAREPASSSF